VAIVRFSRVADLRARLDRVRGSGAGVGLVPTMGALHDGHGSLIEAASARNQEVVTTVFVNPLQFGPNEDFTAYPRGLDADLALAEAAGATVLFAPGLDEMYPGGPAAVRTTVHVAGVTAPLEGAHRPGHFDGVATVVAKLFAIAGPCTAYFGEKDFQQLAVVRRMAADLSLPVQVVGCPTVREANGLAMSSRNRYLTDDERNRAAVIFRALVTGRDLVEGGESSPDAVSSAMRSVLASEAVVSSIDYVAVVDPATFDAPVSIAGEVRLLIAARVGRARLIDNVGARSPSP
jgi:pantoate--beta-alanine ligase